MYEAAYRRCRAQFVASELAGPAASLRALLPAELQDALAEALRHAYDDAYSMGYMDGWAEAEERLTDAPEEGEDEPAPADDVLYHPYFNYQHEEVNKLTYLVEVRSEGALVPVDSFGRPDEVTEDWNVGWELVMGLRETYDDFPHMFAVALSRELSRDAVQGAASAWRLCKGRETGIFQATVPLADLHTER